MVSIEDATRKKRDQKIALFFMLVIIMGLAVMIISPQDSEFNSRCTRCYFCVEKCPVGAISLDDHGYPVINKTKCLAWRPNTKGGEGQFKWDACGLCLRGCPTKVIDLVDTNLEEREIKTTD